MNRRLTSGITGAIALLVLAAPLPAGEGRWVAADGSVRHPGHAVFLEEGAAETFDVADLLDGELRVFGAGADEITVARRGDEVTIERAAESGSAEPTIKCRLGTDHCKILTFADAPEKVLVLVERTEACEEGAAACGDLHLRHAIAGDAMQIVLHERVECPEGEECEPVLERSATLVLEALGGRPLGALLRCPEGDARITVEEDEAAQVFLCPKHSVPMERVESPAHEVLLERIRTDH